MMALAYHEQRQIRFYTIVFILLITALSSYFFFDKPLAWTMLSLDTPAVHHFFSLITSLGKGIYWLGLFFIFLCNGQFVFTNKKIARWSLFFLMSLSISGLICDFLKYVLGRSRPPLLFQNIFMDFIFLKPSF